MFRVGFLLRLSFVGKGVGGIMVGNIKKGGEYVWVRSVGVNSIWGVMGDNVNTKI